MARAIRKAAKADLASCFLHYDDVGNETELDDYVAPSLKGTTSQRMELEACVTALKKAPTMDCYERVYSVVIRTDSRYVSDYYYSALTHWRNNKWCNRHGKPVDNTDLWREFVRAYEKIRKPKTIEWVKGHGKGLQKDPHNYTADKLAKAFSRNPLTRSEYRASVRRKTSPHKTEVGSIGAHGQQLRIRVIENERLRFQKKWKYRCEVVSTDSPYYENVDWLYSNEYLRDGHYYEVLLNDNPNNPTIVDMIREFESLGDDEPETPVSG